MYQHFYGLRELPFELTPNPLFLFLPARHREALSNLRYGVCSAKSLTLLIGEAGTGKTTLLRTILESEECSHVRWVYLNNPIVSREDFVRMLAARFEIRGAAAESKGAFLDALEQILRERQSRGEQTVLVVDEAQSLSNDLLEEIRLLANIETADRKLLLLILAGQPELAERLNDPGLRQLKQRVALRCEIAPFNLVETGAYIAHRLETAGCESQQLFTREAVEAIHAYSSGVPRTINVICDNALLGGLALGRSPVDRELILDVARDFDLKPSAELEPPAPPAPAAPDLSPEPSPDSVQMRPVPLVVSAAAATLPETDAAPVRRRWSRWFGGGPVRMGLSDSPGR
jgi:general secretion pathway protein A